MRLAILTTKTLTDLTTDLVVANNNITIIKLLLSPTLSMHHRGSGSPQMGPITIIKLLLSPTFSMHHGGLGSPEMGPITIIKLLLSPTLSMHHGG